jgi:hypothetical protein
MDLPPSGLPPLVMVSACTTLPSTRVFVTAGVEPAITGFKFSFAQLQQLSREVNRAGPHPPYGFYFGAIALSIGIDIGNAADDLCQGPVAIRVSLRLADRRIEVAQDLTGDPCRFPKIMAHYRHHAEADAAVFQRYSLKVAETLVDLSEAAFAGAYGAENPRPDILRLTQTMIEPVLRALNADREAAREAVDHPAEVRELEAACSDHI